MTAVSPILQTYVVVNVSDDRDRSSFYPVVIRFNPRGEWDETFAQTGALSLQNDELGDQISLSDIQFHVTEDDYGIFFLGKARHSADSNSAPSELTSGRRLVNRRRTLFVSKYNGWGEPERFGSNGITKLKGVLKTVGDEPSSLAIDPITGKIAVLVNTVSAPDRVGVVGLLTADGHPVTSFGSNGLIDIPAHRFPHKFAGRLHAERIWFDDPLMIRTLFSGFRPWGGQDLLKYWNVDILVSEGKISEVHPAVSFARSANRSRTTAIPVISNDKTSLALAFVAPGAQYRRCSSIGCWDLSSGENKSLLRKLTVSYPLFKDVRVVSVQPGVHNSLQFLVEKPAGSGQLVRIRLDKDLKLTKLQNAGTISPEACSWILYHAGLVE